MIQFFSRFVFMLNLAFSHRNTSWDWQAGRVCFEPGPCGASGCGHCVTPAIPLSVFLRRDIVDKRQCIESDPAPRGVGCEGVDDFQFARDILIPLGRPLERLRLAFPTMLVEIAMAASWSVAAELDWGGTAAWTGNPTAWRLSKGGRRCGAGAFSPDSLWRRCPCSMRCQMRFFMYCLNRPSQFGLGCQCGSRIYLRYLACLLP